MNFLEADLTRRNGSAVASLPSHDVPVPARWADERKTVIAGFRPEAVSEVADAHPGVRLHGRVELVEALGPEVIAHITVDARPALTEEVREIARDSGEEMSGDAREATVLGRFGASSRAAVGQRIELTIDLDGLLFFDPVTGAALSA
jgi:multiple sugar transport system ATP-binding protein